MKNDREMSEAEKRLAFRLAVTECLVTFYGQTPPKSEMMVDGWWKRISATSSFLTGFFMHSEPINTAARLADKQVVEIDAQNAATYNKILSASRSSASGVGPLKGARRKPSGKATRLQARQLA